MKVRRLALVSLALAACGLDITGVAITDTTTPAIDSGVDGAVKTLPDGGTTTTGGGDDDDDDDVSPPLDAGKDATTTSQVDGGGGTIIATVAANTLRGIAISPDGNDLYIARAGQDVMHLNFKAPASTDTISVANDSHAIAWAQDIPALLYVRSDNIGRFDPPPPPGTLTNDDHGGEHSGVDIIYGTGGGGRMIASYNDKITSYDPKQQQIAVSGELATQSQNLQPAGLVADDKVVFWADTAKNVVGKATYAPTITVGDAFLTGLNAPTSVALDATNLYVAQADSIVSASPTAPGNTVANVVANLSHPVSLMFAGGMLYWLEATGDFKRAAPTGAQAGVVATLSGGTAFTDFTHQHLIAFAGKNAYWGNPADGTVRRLQVMP